MIEDLKKWEKIKDDFSIQYFYSKKGIGKIFAWIHKKGHLHVSEMLRQEKEDRILDLGCGFGTIRRYIKKGFYTGIDISYSRILNASLKIDRSTVFLNADGLHLPFKDSSFEKVISVYNLEHIQKLEEVLAEVKRLMTPNGQFIVSIPAEGGIFWNTGRKLTTQRIVKKKYNINYSKVVRHEHCNGYKEILKILLKHFKIDKKKYWPFDLLSPELNLILTMSCKVKRRVF